MPSYRVKITGLGAHKDIPSLVKLLSGLPGLSADKIRTGIQHPPLELPPVPQEESAQQLTDALARLGAICVIERIREAPVIEKAKVERLDLSKVSSGRAPVETRAPTTISAPPHPPPPRRQTTGHPRLRLALVLIGILLLFLIPYFLPKSNRAPAKPNDRSSQKTTTKTIKRPAPAAKSTKPGMQEKHAQARKQQVYSEQMVDRSRQTTNPKESARHLQAAVQYNPYNAEAWQELEQKMLEIGDTEGAKAARKAHEQAMRVQNTLQSVAKAFGTTPKVAVSTSTIVYNASAELDDQEFYDAVGELYDSVSAAHPEKELQVENHTGSHVQRLHIIPGTPYPDAVETE